ncbi:ABC transporter permease [Xanthomonas sacchari]|uniref:ABC transporter permease n=1 Tax=Xanthomonas sacchari TaxID=56458 RepID=UPI0035276741
MKPTAPLLADIRYALRLLAKTPRFTLLTIAVLAGGLAISIYTYSVLNTMIYKDLPIPGGGSVLRVQGKKDGRNVSIDAFELAHLRHARSIREIAAYQTGRSVITEFDATRSVKSTEAEWSIFSFARTRPLMGRGFLPEDSVVGAEPVAVISYRLWKALYSGDPAIVDKVVQINGKYTRIVGVMPDGFMFPISAELWTPLTERQLNPATYGTTAYSAYGRLAAGATQDQASAELSAMLRQVYVDYPRREGDESLLDGMVVNTFQKAQTGPESAFIFAILNVVSIFILLLACVNVGNMLLARTNERIKEIAIRISLGAPRRRLVLQMMMESTIICLVGGMLALGLAGLALRATNRFLASTFEGDLAFWWNWGLDSGAVLSAVAFVAIAIVLVSVLPTWSATNISSSALLRDGTRGAQGRTTGRISRALVVVEIVLISVVLIIGSMMAMVAYRAARVDFGIDTRNLLTMPVTLTGEAYSTPQKQLQFYERLLAELRHSQSLEAAGILQELGEVRFGLDGVEYQRDRDYPAGTLVVVSALPQPLGVRLLEGRYFDSRDSATGLKTVVVSESVAKTHWPVQGALGQRMRVLQEGLPAETRTVIGVVTDARRGDLLKTSAKSFSSLYVPLPQAVLPNATVVVKHTGNVENARSTIYRTVAGIDPYLTPSRITSYEEVQQRLTLMATTMTDLFVRCGVFAMLLAMTGIYGLSSNAVIQRTHEVGLRRAIGARDRDIIALFLKQGVRQLSVGLGISILLSAAILFAVSRFVGVGAPVLILMGLAVMIGISALVLGAIFIATRRAVLHEPSVALRYE